MNDSLPTPTGSMPDLQAAVRRARLEDAERSSMAADLRQAEIARLEKEHEKTAGFIEAKRKKLADENFAARAPEAVVAKERAQLAELEAKLANGKAALADLRSRKPTSGS